jgi:hypothetical protein
MLGLGIANVGLRVSLSRSPTPLELLGVIAVPIGVMTLASTHTTPSVPAIVTDNRLSNTRVSTVALWMSGFPIVMFKWDELGHDHAEHRGRHYRRPAVWHVILLTRSSYEASILGASSVTSTAPFTIPILGERLAMHHIAGMALMLVRLSLVQVRQNLGRGMPWWNVLESISLRMPSRVKRRRSRYTRR